jgi:hypothetical protein
MFRASRWTGTHSGNSCWMFQTAGAQRYCENWEDDALVQWAFPEGSGLLDAKVPR